MLRHPPMVSAGSPGRPEAVTAALHNGREVRMPGEAEFPAHISQVAAKNCDLRALDAT
jgi:hypothetical protein